MTISSLKKHLLSNPVEKIYLILISFIGIYLRFWWIYNIPNSPIYDFQTYYEIATNVYKGLGHSLGGHPIAFQGMGYPMALGYFFRLAGNNAIHTAKLFNVILSIVTLVFIYLMLINITNRKCIILTTYTIVALLPNFIAYNNVLGTEVFITFIYSIVIFLQTADFNYKFRYPLLGLFIGIAALTKPFFMVYPILVALTYWLKEKKLKEAGAILLIVTITMSLVIAPWTIRNYRHYGELISVSYNSGYVFYINNNDNNTTGAWMALEDTALSPELQFKVSEILEHGNRSVKLAYELDSLLKPEAVKWILKNPSTFIKLGALRLQSTFFRGAWDIPAWTMNEWNINYTSWTPQEYERNMELFTSTTGNIIYIISTLGLLYMVLNIKNIVLGILKKDRHINYIVTIPTLNIAFFTAIYFVFEGQARYNFPVLFLLTLATGITIDILKNSKLLQEN